MGVTNALEVTNVYTDTTDTTKSVMTDDSGEWFIVPAKHVNDWISKGRESVIVHQCHLWTVTCKNDGGLLYYKKGYWTLAEHLETPCKLCSVRPPDSIAQAWLLHNFDTFCNDSMDRTVAGMINKAFEQYDRRIFLGALGLLDEKYGPDE